MKRILVLGAGLSASSLIRYLLNSSEQYHWQIRVVDQELAYNLGDKVLGAQSGLGSQVTLGEFTIQKVNDQLYWVAPLLHSGFFKWNKNRI